METLIHDINRYMPIPIKPDAQQRVLQALAYMIERYGIEHARLKKEMVIGRGGDIYPMEG